MAAAGRSAAQGRQLFFFSFSIWQPLWPKFLHVKQTKSFSAFSDLPSARIFLLPCKESLIVKVMLCTTNITLQIHVLVIFKKLSHSCPFTQNPTPAVICSIPICFVTFSQTFSFQRRVCAQVLEIISINLLVFYHECRSLIGYATRYLFCDR